MDQFVPWQVVPRQVFTPYVCILVSVAFVVLCRVGCLLVTVVIGKSLSILCVAMPFFIRKLVRELGSFVLALPVQNSQLSISLSRNSS